VDTVKKRKQDKAQIVIPSKTQFRALLAQLRQETRAEDAANLVEFLGYSGLRLGEGTQVQWQDVNFDLGTLLVTGGEQGTKNHEERSVPLFPPLRRLLTQMHESEVARLVRKSPAGEGCGSADGPQLPHAGAKPEQPVCGQVGRALEGRIFKVDSAKTALITACRKAGLPHYGHHAMRHFFCSNAIEAGCDFKVIAAWLGHKDGGVLVARTYGHLRNEHSAAMAKLITFDAGSTGSRV
jgi:integrase